MARHVAGLKLLNLWVVLCLCAVAPPPLFSESLFQEANGMQWRQFPGAMRSAYVFGYMDALQREGAQSRFAKVKVGEVVAGLNQFYAADFRNLPVSLGDATWLVLLTATGESPALVRDRLTALRSAAH